MSVAELLAPPAPMPGTPPAKRWFKLFIMVILGDMPDQPGLTKLQILPVRKKVPMRVAWKWVAANNFGKIHKIICLAREVDEDGEFLGDSCIEPASERFRAYESHDPFLDHAVETDLPIGDTEFDCYLEGGAE